jgi:hypothetical protein
MAQRKQITWSELRVGLFVLVGLLILAVAIFYVTGAGFLGPKYRLKTFLPEVSGLAVGAPVRLDGVEIGNVEKIRLVPREAGKTPDRMHNIEVDIRLDARYQGDVLTDSTSSPVTEGLLGNRFVMVKRGYRHPSQGWPDVPAPKSHQGSCRAQRRRSRPSRPSAKKFGHRRRRSVRQGTIGKLLYDDQAITPQQHLAKGVKCRQRAGGAGNSRQSHMTDELYPKWTRPGQRQLHPRRRPLPKGTIGKLLYDPPLRSGQVRLENGNNIMGDIRAGKGTLGKLTTTKPSTTNSRHQTNLSKPPQAQQSITP